MTISNDFPYEFNDSVVFLSYDDVDEAFRILTPNMEAWTKNLDSSYLTDEIMEHWREAWLLLDEDDVGTCSELSDLLDELQYVEEPIRENLRAFARKVFDYADCWLYDDSDD